MRPTQVTVKLPCNVTSADRYLFDAHQTYQLDPLTIKKAQFVFVSYIGYCMDETGFMKECHHSYPEQYQDYLNDVGYYFKQASEDESNMIYLEDDNEYLIIHHPWANYYHWMTEAVAKLWLIQDQLANLVLVLPEDLKRNTYVTGSLAPFSFKEIFYIPINKNLFIKNICLPQLKPVSETYNTEIVNQQRSFYVNHTRNNLKIYTFAGKRLYISRKLASKRKIENEEAVEKLLAKYDFTIVHCEQYTFEDQVAIFSQADFLISIHGAGLTNMLFMPHHASILELHKRMTNSRDQHSFVYWRLASALDQNYYHQVCEPTDPNADFFLADMHVDIQKLEDNIKTMIADYKIFKSHAEAV